MQYFLDTEFHEYRKSSWFGKETDTIELISIGIMSGNGHDYYAICKDFDVKKAWKNKWLKENVLAPIFHEMYQKHSVQLHRYNVKGRTNLNFNVRSFKYLLKRYGVSREVIAEEITEFVYRENDGINPRYVANFSEIIKFHPIEFYAYYADYDWVVFCWLFGRMIDLPKGFPMYCIDLKQEMDRKAHLHCRKTSDMSLNDAIEDMKRHKDYPEQDNEHNALDDARWNGKLYYFLNHKL